MVMFHSFLYVYQEAIFQFRAKLIQSLGSCSLYHPRCSSMFIPNDPIVIAIKKKNWDDYWPGSCNLYNNRDDLYGCYMDVI